jgi:hypothetical protein
MIKMTFLILEFSLAVPTPRAEDLWEKVNKRI